MVEKDTMIKTIVSNQNVTYTIHRETFEYEKNWKKHFNDIFTNLQKTLDKFLDVRNKWSKTEQAYWLVEFIKLVNLIEQQYEYFAVSRELKQNKQLEDKLADLKFMAHANAYFDSDDIPEINIADFTYNLINEECTRIFNSLGNS